MYVDVSLEYESPRSSIGVVSHRVPFEPPTPTSADEYVLFTSQNDIVG